MTLGDYLADLARTVEASGAAGLDGPVDTAIDAIVAGELDAVEQDESLVTHAKKITTTDAALDWLQSATDLCLKVRAYNPVPGAHFRLGEERVKCWRANAVDATDSTPGTVVSADRDGIVVACGEGAVALQELQRPGKSRVSAREFSAQTNPQGQVLA